MSNHDIEGQSLLGGEDAPWHMPHALSCIPALHALTLPPSLSHLLLEAAVSCCQSVGMVGMLELSFRHMRNLELLASMFSMARPDPLASFCSRLCSR